MQLTVPRHAHDAPRSIHLTYQCLATLMRWGFGSLSHTQIAALMQRHTLVPGGAA